MDTKLAAFWEQLTESFWFIPALMMAAALVLGFLMPQLDASSATGGNSPILDVSPDGARALLSTIAGSMISVAGVAFSITIATLSLASSQLGPRLLSNFMRDQGNQITLGTFVSIFTYCLLVLQTVRSADTVTFVPYRSVALAMVMAVFSVFVLIYFFHHVSNMIQASQVIANIGRELEHNIARKFRAKPRHTGYEKALRDDGDLPEDFDDNVAYVTAPMSGYLQALDLDDYQTLATKKDLVLRILYHPGDFVAKSTEVIAVYPRDQLSDAIIERAQDALTIGAQRLHIQDIKFSVEQLVEIAVRALSPGINNPFTAIACLDQFSATFVELAEHPLPSGYYYDAQNKLRVVRETVTFESLLNTAFDPIRQHGRSDVAVTIRLLEVIAIIASRATTASQKQVLLQQANMIQRASEEAILEEHDRDTIAERHALALRVLEEDDLTVAP